MAHEFRNALKFATQVQGFRVTFEYSTQEPNGKSTDNMWNKGGVVCTVHRDNLSAMGCREDGELALRVALQNYTDASMKLEAEKQKAAEEAKAAAEAGLEPLVEGPQIVETEDGRTAKPDESE